jgi:hypothetical protein
VFVCPWNEALHLFVETVLEIKDWMEAGGVKCEILTKITHRGQCVRYGDETDVSVVFLAVHSLLKRLNTNIILYTLYILQASLVSADTR